MQEHLEYQGKVWLFGDNVDTDQILPGYAMSFPKEQLKDHAMAGSDISDFAQRLQAGDIIVAGKNFGTGSSREQAPVALKDAGVSAVIAVSFARIFRRNAINIGLPVLVADLAAGVQTGAEITLNLPAGQIKLPDGRTIQGQVPGESVLAILKAGGLIPRVRQQLSEIQEGQEHAGTNQSNHPCRYTANPSL
jgi:3-isopropylmalate dehydratase small subunit